MSVIQIQNNKIKERAIVNLSENNIKITKENIKKNIENTKKIFDVGYPFSKPLNLNKKENLHQGKYESFFKILNEDIDTLFKSKNANLNDMEKIKYNIENNRNIVKKALKDLEKQIENYSTNDNINKSTILNFNKINDLEFLTSPYTDAYIDLENAIAYNNIKEFKTYTKDELDFKVYAETLIDNKKTINDITEIYNNKYMNMFLFKAITKEEKEVTINIDITNKSNKKRINELILKLQSNNYINVKLLINNNNEYIIQDSKDTTSKISFDINREVDKIRISLTKKYDYKENDLYYYNFFIENLVINKNTYENKNYIVTKPININTEKFKINTSEQICHSGDITYFYSLDTDILDWKNVDKNKEIILPNTLLEQKVVNSKYGNFFGIDFGNKYTIDINEIGNKEKIEILIGENLENVEYFTDNIDRDLYKTIFNNNIIEKTYFKSNDKKAVLNFKNHKYVYLKTEQAIDLKSAATLNIELISKTDLLEQQLEHADIFKLVDVKAFINESEIQLEEAAGFNKEITITENNIFRVFYKFEINNYETTQLNQKFEVKTAIYNILSNEDRKEIDNIYGVKGVMNSNRNYNNYSIDDKNRIFIFSNPNDNILKENQLFNIIINKKIKEIKIRILALMTKEKNDERNVIESISILEID